MPKLRMIWSGETVLVSKLVSDHTKTVRSRNVFYSSHPDKTESQNKVQALEFSESYVPHLNVDCNNYDRQKSEGTTVMDTGESTHSKMGNHHLTGEEMPSLSNQLSHRSTTRASVIRRSMNGKDGNKIYISNTAAPSRRLLLPLVDMQSTLLEMNQRIMAGLGVSENEWMSLRQQSIDLGQMFNDQVHFQWEQSSSFEATSKRENLSVDIESNNRTKQMSLDTFGESDNKEEDDDADSDLISNDKGRIQRKRLEL